jgi:hypothetical protein
MIDYFRKRECRKVRELLSEYLNGNLSQRDMERVSRHLSRCEGCLTEFHSLKETAELLHELPQEIPSPPFVISEADKRIPIPKSWLRKAFIPAAITSVLVFTTWAIFLNLGREPIEDNLVELEKSPPVGISAEASSLQSEEKKRPSFPMLSTVALAKEENESAAVTEEKVLFHNSSFEEGELDFPYYWKREVENWWGAELVWDKNQSRGGEASIFIGNRNWFNLETKSWCQDIWNVPLDEHVILCGFIKTEGLSSWGRVQICIQCLDSEGRVIASSTTYHARFSGNHDWTEVGTDIVVPPETSHMKVICSLRGKGKVWFDDINLLVDGVSTYSKDQ